jgi:metallo-beta-lactamase family protein
LDVTILGAAREVTGSCYLVRTGGATVLLECGQVQGESQDEARNSEDLPIRMNELDAVVLSRSHIDHSGRIPLLVKQGYAGPIYTHHASQALCEIMLLDSGYLHEQSAKWENKRRRALGLPRVAPLYTREDVAKTLPYFVGMSYDAVQEILPGIRLRLSDAGHILGAAIVELWHSTGEATSKLVFSGDLGYKYSPVLRDALRERYGVTVTIPDRGDSITVAPATGSI